MAGMALQAVGCAQALGQLASWQAPASRSGRQTSLASIPAQGVRRCRNEGLPKSYFCGQQLLKACSAGSQQQVAGKKQNKGASVTCQAQTSQEAYAVAGGTGFVGSKLVEQLLAGGYKVKVLTRSKDKARSVFRGSKFAGVEFAEPYEWNRALAGCTGVVNLSGTPISTRWSDEIKRDIKRSRVETTKRLVEAINALPEGEKPKVLVNSSALGYYGISDTAAFDENSPSGDGFLAEVCCEWEDAARAVNGTRVVLLRTGIVLDKDGGALGKMLPVFQLFAGGPLGSGRQWFSWVHRDDLAALIVEALRNPKYEGPINGTAPNPVRMGEMCQALGRVLGRPSWLPVPSFALQALLGEGASVVLEGQRVLPKKAEKLGYKFKYPEISGALKAILSS